jgi:hypothetical protein
MVGTDHPVLLGHSVRKHMRQERLTQDVSYDVYVKLGVDHMGRPEFSDAIAHFREQDNAVAYKRQLEARGETVHVHESAIYGFSEAEKEEWFMHYEPEAPIADRLRTSASATEAAPSASPGDGSESSDRPIEPWYRRLFGG